MDLTKYTHIVINSSSGKDSQAMTDYVCELAHQQSVTDRLLMVHAELEREEWPGSKELAQHHAAIYEIPILIVKREAGGLLEHVQARGKWPDSQNRYCTSDHKRDPIAKVIRHLKSDGHAHVLNCLGMRADESPARAKRQPLSIDARLSNGRRTVHTWLPLHGWTTADVWARIKASGVQYHYAYDLGMPRVSCIFCIFAPKAALLIAGKHNPSLLAEYVRIEKKIGHTFRKTQTLASIKEELDAGVTVTSAPDWAM